MASLVVCIHETVGLWRMDFEQSLWSCLERFVFYGTLLVKYDFHLVASLV